jgi:hypothetical protein
LPDEEDEACSSSKEFLHSNRSDQILLENYGCLRIEGVAIVLLGKFEELFFNMQHGVYMCSMDPSMPK